MSGSRNRTTGHKKEVQLAERFRQVGFPNCKTSRACNRFRDSQKIDLAYDNEAVQGRMPYNVQSKDVVTINPFEVYEQIPKDEEIINILAITKRKKSGSKFMTQGKYVMMSEEDFFEMVRIINQLKEETRLIHN